MPEFLNDIGVNMVDFGDGNINHRIIDNMPPPAIRLKPPPIPNHVRVNLDINPKFLIGDDFAIPNEVVFKPGTLSEVRGMKVDGLFGIEIEVEGEELPRLQNKTWITKDDGSLRGESAEYILYQPLDLKKAVSAINTLNKAFKDFNSLLDFSFRTSVHVHVNISELTKRQLISFIYLSHLVEDALVGYSGNERVGNRFCLRTKDAEYKVFCINDFIANRGFTHKFGMEDLKYSAINLAAISQRMSVEFRSMRGTSDIKILRPWLEVLENIHVISSKMEVSDIAAMVLNTPKDFLELVFGKHYPLFEYENILNDLRFNYSNLIGIPHTKVG